jgi:hypothetical protein
MFSQDEIVVLNDIIACGSGEKIANATPDDKDLLKKLLDWDPENCKELIEVWFQVMNTKEEQEDADKNDDLKPMHLELRLNMIKKLKSFITDMFFEETTEGSYYTQGKYAKELLTKVPAIKKILVKKYDIDDHTCKYLPKRLIDTDTDMVCDKYFEDVIYATISYTWGDDEHVESSIEGVTWNIPRSAEKSYEIAKKAAKLLNIKWIWMDAFCINQENEDEKESEIAKMGKYYEESALCIVLLPEINSYKMGKLTSYNIKMELLDNTYKMVLLYEMGQANTDNIKQQHIEMCPLVECGWLYRQWILQELFLSKKLVAYCNEDEEEFIIDLDKILYNIDKFFTDMQGFELLRQGLGDEYALLVDSAKLRSKKLDQKNYKKCTFAEAIVSAAKRRCGRTIDKLNGLMGILGVDFDSNKNEHIQLQALDSIKTLKKDKDDNTWLQLSTNCVEDITVGFIDINNSIIVNEVMVPNGEYDIDIDEIGIYIETDIWTYGKIKNITPLEEIIYDGDDDYELLQWKIEHMKLLFQGQGASKELLNQLDTIPNILKNINEDDMSDIQPILQLLYKCMFKFSNLQSNFVLGIKDKDTYLKIVWTESGEMFVTNGMCQEEDDIVLTACNTAWVIRKNSNNNGAFTRVGCIASYPYELDKNKLTFIGKKRIYMTRFGSNLYMQIMNSSIPILSEIAVNKKTKEVTNLLQGSKFTVTGIVMFCHEHLYTDFFVEAVGDAFTAQYDETHVKPLEGINLSLEYASLHNEYVDYDLIEETKEFLKKVRDYILSKSGEHRVVKTITHVL